MNEELTNKLVIRFPILYQNCRYFACGDGWFNLLWELSADIEATLAYSKWQKRGFLLKKWAAKHWNTLMYRLSPLSLSRNKTRPVGKGTKEDPIRCEIVEVAKGDWLQRLANRLPNQNWPTNKGLLARLQVNGIKTFVWQPYTGMAVSQVKEKFGTLRYYCPGNDRIYALIGGAESTSAVTCEACGKPGKLRGGHWLQTLCEDHACGSKT